MRIVNKLFGDSVKVDNIIKKGKVIIVTIDNKKYVIKESKNDIESIYEYLESRDFNNFPELLFTKDGYNVYEYLDDIDNPIEQKAYDMITLLSLLHEKTTYYKTMDIDEYKEIYENINNDILNKLDYYNNLITIIETHMFQSPSEYLIARNISKILGALEYSKKSIDEWYDLVKNNAKKRIVTLYNNIDLDHLIRNKDLYLLSWNKSIKDIPIYDLYNFYIKYSNFDFEDLLKKYEKKYPLLKEEKKLFYILISIPNIIKLDKDEITNCKNVKKMIDYLYKSEVLISNDNK